MARDVRYPDFQRFVDEKGLETPCRECGQMDWQMLGSEEGPDRDFMFLAAADEAKIPPEKMFAYYIMYCGHCGTMKSIAASVVWDWLEADNG
jgi:hypothetical protein